MQIHNSLIVLNFREEPVITGTDVTVARILERLSSDDTIDKICNDYRLTKEQVHAALSYAEMHLVQSEQYKVLDSLLNGAAPDDDELDYSLLTENAGYFSADTCSLHLLHKYRKRAKRSHMSAEPAMAAET